MVFAATIFQLRQSFDTRMGDRVHQQSGLVDDKRKRFSEPHTSSPIHTPNAGSLLLDRRRQSMGPIGAEQMSFPPTENHVAAATLRHTKDSDNIRTSRLWSLKSPHQLAEQGIQLLTQMGTQYPKAAELASILRIRSMAGPTTADMSSSSFAKPVLARSLQWPPPAVLSPIVGWTPGTRMGFQSLGVNSIPGFAALTANPTAVTNVTSDEILPNLDTAGPMSVSENGNIDSYFDVSRAYLGPTQQPPGSTSAYSGYSSGFSPVAMTSDDGGVGNLYGQKVSPELY